MSPNELLDTADSTHYHDDAVAKAAKFSNGSGDLQAIAPSGDGSFAASNGHRGDSRLDTHSINDLSASGSLSLRSADLASSTPSFGMPLDIPSVSEASDDVPDEPEPCSHTSTTSSSDNDGDDKASDDVSSEPNDDVPGETSDHENRPAGDADNIQQVEDMRAYGVSDETLGQLAALGEQLLLECETDDQSVDEQSRASNRSSVIITELYDDDDATQTLVTEFERERALLAVRLLSEVDDSASETLQEQFDRVDKLHNAIVQADNADVHVVAHVESDFAALRQLFDNVGSKQSGVVVFDEPERMHIALPMTANKTSVAPVCVVVRREHRAALYSPDVIDSVLQLGEGELQHVDERLTAASPAKSNASSTSSKKRRRRQRAKRQADAEPASSDAEGTPMTTADKSPKRRRSHSARRNRRKRASESSSGTSIHLEIDVQKTVIDDDVKSPRSVLSGSMADGDCQTPVLVAFKRRDSDSNIVEMPSTPLPYTDVIPQTVNSREELEASRAELPNTSERVGISLTEANERNHSASSEPVQPMAVSSRSGSEAASAAFLVRPPRQSPRNDFETALKRESVHGYYHIEVDGLRTVNEQVGMTVSFVQNPDDKERFDTPEPAVATRATPPSTSGQQHDQSNDSAADGASLYSSAQCIPTLDDSQPSAHENIVGEVMDVSADHRTTIRLGSITPTTTSAFRPVTRGRGRAARLSRAALRGVHLPTNRPLSMTSSDDELVSAADVAARRQYARRFLTPPTRTPTPVGDDFTHLLRRLMQSDGAPSDVSPERWARFLRSLLSLQLWSERARRWTASPALPSLPSGVSVNASDTDVFTQAIARLQALSGTANEARRIAEQLNEEAGEHVLARHIDALGIDVERRRLCAAVPFFDRRVDASLERCARAVAEGGDSSPLAMRSRVRQFALEELQRAENDCDALEALTRGGATVVASNASHSTLLSVSKYNSYFEGCNQLCFCRTAVSISIALITASVSCDVFPTSLPNLTKLTTN